MRLSPPLAEGPSSPDVPTGPSRRPSAAAAQELNPAAPQGFDFRHLWHTLLEKSWIIALCTLAGLFLALGYLARTPKLYQSRIVLEIDVAETAIAGAEDGGPNRMRTMFLASQEGLRTLEQNLTNRTLLSRVVRSEGLAEDGGAALLGEAKAAPPPAPRPKQNTAAAGAAAGPEDEAAFTPTELGLGGALAGMVRPVIRRGTRLIDLYVTHRDPAMAQRLVEAIGREYIRSFVERRSSTTQETLRFLLEEEQRLKANLQKSEAAVAEYKATTPDALQLGGGTASTGSQAGAGAGAGTGRGGLVEDRLQDLSTRSSAARTDRQRLEGELAQVDQAGQDVEALLAIPSIANAPAVTDRRRDFAQAQSAIAVLSQRYKERHPRMASAQAALEETRAALNRAVLEQPAVLRNNLQQARANEQNLASATGDQEKAAIALNRAAIGYQELARQAETDRALYESVLRQIKATDLTKGVKSNAVTVVERASLPGRPISPKPTKTISLGILLGLASGLGLIYGINAIDRSIKTVDQAESTLGLPVLAAVPEVKPGEASSRPKDLASDTESASYRLLAEAPEGPAAEAFRNLRAALSLLGPESERRVNLFTSALPSEGKSFTSANYSLSLAQQGHRVLLIDGDLRRPSLQKIFKRPESASRTPRDAERGLVDCLVGASTLANSVHPVEASQVDVLGGALKGTVTSTGGELWLLAGGRRAPNPAELLSGRAFAELVAEAARTFDRVVIDSAPVLAVSDTLLMTAYVQTICLVVRARKTARHAVSRALGMINGTGIRPAGVVLNRLPRQRGTGYYYYYASHGYGAGEGSYSGGYDGQNEPSPGRSRKRSDAKV